MTEPANPAAAPEEEPVETFVPASIRARHDGWTPVKQRRFVEVLADTGCVGVAADAVGMSRMSAYRLRRRAPNSMFAYAWDAALRLAHAQLLDIAMERAIEGTPTTVYYRGEAVGERVQPDNRLLMFLLSRGADFDRVGRNTDELVQIWPALLDAIELVGPPPYSDADLKQMADQGGRIAQSVATGAAVPEAHFPIGRSAPSWGSI